MSDRATRLTAARDRLAQLLANADEKEAPGLSREYRAVLAELEKLSPPEEGSTSDDLAKRRKRRRSAGA